MIARKIKISGKVQGVWYRASTKEKADSLGVYGWVKNELNGSVLIEAEGEEKLVSELITWCKVGPPLARVENVVVDEIELQGFDTFDVKHS